MSAYRRFTWTGRAVPLLAALLVLSLPMVASAATAGELLEKAIYAEETVGNLDEAIDLYEQVIAEGKEASAAAAQAQLRLGVCYQKQGKADLAAAAFQAVVDGYPQEKELVAEARKHLPAAMKLLPFPWKDGEQLQFNLKLGTGLDIATMIYMIDAAKYEGKDVWQCSTRGMVLNGMTSFSDVTCDKTSFAPIRSHWEHTALGSADAVYKEDSVKITTAGKSEPRVIKINSPPVWDNEQGVELFRLLPLKEGFKTALTVVATLGAGEIGLVAEVTKKETIEVPAGKFECYKLELNIGQTFWISTDEHRYLVRFEAGGVSGDLVKIGTRQTAPTPLSTDRFSVDVPVGWHSYSPSNKLEEDDFQKIYLLDERGECSVEIAVGAKSSLKKEQQASTLAWTESFVKEAAQEAKDFKLVDPGVQDTEIAGRKVTTLLAEFTELGKPKNLFGVAEFSETSAATLKMTALADKFDANRPAMDEIVNSFKLK